MQWKIDDLPLFIAVVEQRGISAAAEHLGLGKSVVSKALQRLEQALGLRLLERNSRGIRLTSDGETFYQQGKRIMTQVDAATAIAQELNAKPAGRLRVALPLAFSREILAPALPEFRRRYPSIDLEIVVCSHSVDVIGDHFDLAVVVGEQENSELFSRCLYRSKLLCVCSPAYAQQQHLNDPLSIGEHIAFCESRYALSRMPVHIGQKRHILDLKKNTVCINDPLSVRQAVLEGGGVTLLPDQYCRHLIHSGHLIEVFKEVEFELSAAVLSVVFPSRQQRSIRAQAFVEFLSQRCAAIANFESAQQTPSAGA